MRWSFWLSVILLWGTASAIQAGEALQRIQQRGVLRWGADQEGGGPFVFPDEDNPNVLIGFEVEIAEQLAKHLGVRAEFVQGQWDKLPDLMMRGDIDIVLNGYEWNPTRSERYSTSIPYYIYELQLLARVNDETLRSWDDVKSPPDGRKKRIAVLTGSAAEKYLQTHYSDEVELVSFEGVSDAMRAVELQLDGIDANLQDLPIWDFYRSRYPQLTAVGAPMDQGYYVALAGKGEGELIAEINRAILQMLQDGRMRQICSRYQMWNSTQAARALETDTSGGFQGGVLTSSSLLNADEETAPQTAQTSRGWGVIWQRGGLLLKAAGMTVLLSVIAMPLAILGGLLLAITRRYGPAFLRIPATFYVEIVRGTPLVLQLYVIFFLLPEIGISLNAFVAAVIGLAINYSAYEAEIYRAGLQAVPTGQMEAALALGMPYPLAIRRIIIPQATRLVIPPVTNDFIALFKDTAVVSVITVVELSKQYYIQAQNTGAIIELGLLTALLYLMMSYPLSILARRLELRLGQEQRQ